MGSYYYKDSKIFYKHNPNSNLLGAVAKNSLILLSVKLYQYPESVLAYFKANPILKMVWTVSKWDIFVLVSSVHIYQHSLLGHSMFYLGVCKYYTLINRTLFGGKYRKRRHSLFCYGVCKYYTLINRTSFSGKCP